jgi:Uma2 family endonuclease
MIAAVAVSDEVRMLSESGVPWTVERFLEFPQELHRYELLNGTLLMSPGPAIDHQRVAMNLAALFRAAFPDHWDVLQEANVEFAADTLLRPDVVVARVRRGVAFTPDDLILAAEVVSPSSRDHDRILKHWLYADFGVQWYVRVELQGEHAPEVVVYRLRNGVYVEHALGRAGQVLTLTEPVNVSLDPGALVKPRM